MGNTNASGGEQLDCLDGGVNAVLNRYYKKYATENDLEVPPTLDAALLEASQPLSVTGGASGCCGVLGGYSKLENYQESVFSQAKEKLIRDIAKDVSDLLSVKTDYIDKAPIEDVITKFKAIVPDPRSDKNVKTSSKVHVELCNRLAILLNKYNNANISDT
jgi:hypothetical protein